MEKKKLIKDFKQAIQDELGECDPEKWGKICQLRATKQGYARLEEMVIRYVAGDGMEIGSALSLIQQELDHQI